MTNQHTYATGAALGVRAQWAQIGGTDTLPGVECSDTTGTVAVVASSSTYGPRAIRVTTAGSGDATRVKIPRPVGSGEFRCHIVFDWPALGGQAWPMFTMYAGAGEFQVWTSGDGSFGPWAGADLYKSPAGTVPAAGVRTRLSLAFKPGGAATDWRVGLYNDTTGALLTQGNGTTAAVSGALGDMYFGKAGWSSGPATTAFDVRAIRVEAGLNASLALLPAETALLPVSGAAVVPLRLAGWTAGGEPSPTGVDAVTALADGDPGTQVAVPAAGAARFALVPMAPPAGVTVVLDAASVTSGAGPVNARLYRADGERVGVDKQAGVGTSAAAVNVSWTPAETAGLTVADWEAAEVEFGTGPLGPLASGGPQWVPGWSDEFAMPGVPDTATWSRLRGDPASGLYDAPYSAANDASSWDASYASVVPEGLELRWDATPSESGGVTYPYTAGLVTSEGLRSFTPPVFIEIRARFTDTPGLWPALWLNPVGTWPPEIDIAEFIPEDTPDGLYHAHFNYHWGTSGAPQQMGWQWYGRQGVSAAGTAWHTYGLSWTADRLQVFHDGAPGPSYQGSVTTLPHFLILSTGVRKGFSPAAGRMQVGYVRTWTF